MSITEHAGLSSELREDGILIITLGRPEALNPWGQGEREAWNGLLLDIERQASQCRVVILTGSGRAFSAGGDRKQFGEMFGSGADKTVRQLLRYQEMCRLACRLSVPVIAAINGMALVGGTSISMMADLRIAGASSLFSAGQVKIGYVPDIGMTYLLPRIVGLTRALEMMLLGKQIDAPTALSIGLINQIAPDGEVLAAAIAMAEQLTQLPEAAVRWIKRTTYLNLDASFEQALNLEAMAEGVLSGTPDVGKLQADFMGKRAR